VGEVALWSPDSRRTATMRGKVSGSPLAHSPTYPPTHPHTLTHLLTHKDAGVVAMLLVSELAAFVTAHGRVGLKLMRQLLLLEYSLLLTAAYNLLLLLTTTRSVSSSCGSSARRRCRR